MDTIGTYSNPIGRKSAAHLYEIEVEGSGTGVYVSASRRDIAASLAERHGYTVRSVNMVG